MILTGANNFSENNDYIIYTVNSNQNGQYSVIIPKNTDNQISMFVDLNMKTDFDSLISNNISKETLLDKINKEYNEIKSNFPQGILIMPMTDINNLTSAVTSNDKQKIFDETKKISGITSELYKKLTESGLEKNKINQKIMIIEKTDIDTKFVEWLKNQMPNFIDGIKISIAAPTTNVNPFANINPFTGEVENNTTTEQPVTSTSDIFTTTKETNPEQELNVATQPETIIPESNNIFESQSNSSTTEQVVTATPTPVEEIKEPQPVNSVSLENTQIIDSIPTNTAQPEVLPQTDNQPQPAPVNQSQPETVQNNIDKKSGGFANILILLVILIVVTVASIELGKFLFNTFGT